MEEKLDWIGVAGAVGETLQLVTMLPFFSTSQALEVCTNCGYNEPRYSCGLQQTSHITAVCCMLCYNVWLGTSATTNAKYAMETGLASGYRPVVLVYRGTGGLLLKVSCCLCCSGSYFIGISHSVGVGGAIAMCVHFRLVNMLLL